MDVKAEPSAAPLDQATAARRLGTLRALWPFIVPYRRQIAVAVLRYRARDGASQIVRGIDSRSSSWRRSKLPPAGTISALGSGSAHNNMSPFMLGTFYWKL